MEPPAKPDVTHLLGKCFTPKKGIDRPIYRFEGLGEWTGYAWRCKLRRVNEGSKVWNPPGSMKPEPIGFSFFEDNYKVVPCEQDS